MYSNLSLIEGTPIGVIDGGSMNKKVIRIKKGDKKDNQEFNIKDGKIVPFYMRQLEGEFPNRIIVAGPSLCGKSFWARELAKDYYDDYHKQGHKICLFTAIPRHKDNIFACDECRNMDVDSEEGSSKHSKAGKNKGKGYKCFCSTIYRVKCDDGLLTEPIDLDELSNSLTIFDDIDRHPSKAIAQELNLLRDKIMNSGRHDNIDLISIAQVLLDGKKTKCSVTNAFQITAFPNGGGRYQLSEFLRRYMSLPKQMIEKIISLPTRWVTINNCNPMFCLHEKGAFII